MGGTVICGGEQHEAPTGLEVRNYLDHKEVRLFRKRKKRIRAVQHVVLHESAGGVDGFRTLAYLDSKGYGVHLCVHPGGVVTAHADLRDDVLVHGNQLNKTSVGVEVVNPYYGCRVRAPYADTLPAQWWTHQDVRRGLVGGYLLPTVAQVRALELLVPWVCELTGVPLVFPTADLDADHPRIRLWRLGAKPGPGVVAHRDFARHADGRYPLEVVRRASRVA